MDRKTTKISATQLFEELERIANFMPASLYWLDANGIVLGFNNAMGNSHGGLKDVRDKVIGKSHDDFYPAHIAKVLNENNKKVIETGESIEFEEKVVNVLTGQTIYYTSIRSPWRDDDGNIIGIVGTSIDITDKKERERLTLENERLNFENEAQKAVAQEQEKFGKLAGQVAHDIRSPLATLGMLVKVCQTLPEAQRIALREAANNIEGIANNLLNNYQKNEADTKQTSANEEPESILTSPLLLQILTDRKYQYQNIPVKFDHQFSQTGHFAWIKVEPTAFKRMLTNVINNAVDALDQKEGKINLNLDADDKQVRITVEDNGKGMRPELVQKILNYDAVTEGKDCGHGIGLSQVHDTLENNEGQWDIKSEPGQGTKFVLTFPRVQSLKWIADTIQLHDDDTVVILDDDTSIHMAWNIRFDVIRKKFPHLIIKHFEQGQEAIDFINDRAPEKKQRIFLLADYELLKQDLNGLDVIKKTEISRSILVTSHYANKEVQKLAAQTDTKILPKQLASEIVIKVGNTTADEKSAALANEIKADEKPPAPADEIKKVDAVFVDDDQPLLDSFTFFAFNKKIHTYQDPRKFLDNLHQYPKDTKMMLDNNFNNFDQKGIQIAEQLHAKGFTQLYLLSGESFSGSQQIPDYLTAIRKTDLDKVAAILNS